ncbi:MAG: adenine nucleotide alpha hydrolase [Deltaproteobacteria bacterium]|nr:adenine nucleotide alpha hydrolase [Deltaproteobacteria bacterium]
MKRKVVMAWSGGKDSALALWRLQNNHMFQVEGLLTTINRHYDRVSIHGVRRMLLRAQAESLGLKLLEVTLPQHAEDEVYARAMNNAMDFLLERGVETVAFGDILLEDVRLYRERMLSGKNMRAEFPLWRENTTEMSREIINCGFRSVVVCVDQERMPVDMLGRVYDESFLDDLPPEVDACGENGEFHTFTVQGPNFRHDVPVMLGPRVEHDNLSYVDMTPVARG